MYSPYQIIKELNKKIEYRVVRENRNILKSIEHLNWTEEILEEFKILIGHKDFYEFLLTKQGERYIFLYPPINF